jgi:hypothetical protein
MHSEHAHRRHHHAAGLAGRAAATALLIAGASLVPRHLTAQVMRYGVVMDATREMLAAAWSDDPQQVERAYCVTNWWAAVPARRSASPANGSGTDVPDTLFRVMEVAPATPINATPNGAVFSCAPGVPELHTHPPATCYADRADQCYGGGPDAYSCQPSREDVQTLEARGDRFAIVQCDRRAFVFYYRNESGAPTVAAAPTRIRDPFTANPADGLSKP